MINGAPTTGSPPIYVLLTGKTMKINHNDWGNNGSNSPMARVPKPMKNRPTTNQVRRGEIAWLVIAKYPAMPLSSMKYFLPPYTSLPRDWKPIPPVKYAVTMTTKTRKTKGRVIEGTLINFSSRLRMYCMTEMPRLTQANAIQAIGLPGRKKSVTEKF